MERHASSRSRQNLVAGYVLRRPSDADADAGRRDAPTRRSKRGCQPIEGQGQSVINQGQQTCITRSSAERSLEEAAEVGKAVEEDMDSPSTVSDRADVSGLARGDGDEGMVMLSVCCGAKDGQLRLKDLRGGSKGSCVLVDGAWITPNEFQAISGRGNAKDWKRSIKHHGRPLKVLMEQGLLSASPPFCFCNTCDSQDDVTKGSSKADVIGGRVKRHVMRRKNSAADRANRKSRRQRRTAETSLTTVDDDVSGSSWDSGKAEVKRRCHGRSRVGMANSTGRETHKEQSEVVMDGMSGSGEDGKVGKSGRPSRGGTPPAYDEDSETIIDCGGLFGGRMQGAEVSRGGGELTGGDVTPIANNAHRCFDCDSDTLSNGPSSEEREMKKGGRKEEKEEEEEEEENLEERKEEMEEILAEVHIETTDGNTGRWWKNNERLNDHGLFSDHGRSNDRGQSNDPSLLNDHVHSNDHRESNGNGLSDHERASEDDRKLSDDHGQSKHQRLPNDHGGSWSEFRLTETVERADKENEETKKQMKNSLAEDNSDEEMNAKHRAEDNICHTEDGSLEGRRYTNPENGATAEKQEAGDIEGNLKRQSEAKNLKQEQLTATGGEVSKKRSETILLIPNYQRGRKDFREASSAPENCNKNTEPFAEVNKNFRFTDFRSAFENAETRHEAAGNSDKAVVPLQRSLPGSPRAGRKKTQMGRCRSTVTSKMADSTTKFDPRSQSAIFEGAATPNGPARKPGDGNHGGEFLNESPYDTSFPEVPFNNTGSSSQRSVSASSEMRMETGLSCRHEAQSSAVERQPSSRSSASRMRRLQPEVAGATAGKRRRRRQRTAIVSSTTTDPPPSDVETLTSQHDTQTTSQAMTSEHDVYMGGRLYVASDAAGLRTIDHGIDFNNCLDTNDSFRSKGDMGRLTDTLHQPTGTKKCFSNWKLPKLPEILPAWTKNDHFTPPIDEEASLKKVSSRRSQIKDVHDAKLALGVSTCVGRHEGYVYDNCGALDLTLPKN